MRRQQDSGVARSSSADHALASRPVPRGTIDSTAICGRDCRSGPVCMHVFPDWKISQHTRRMFLFRAAGQKRVRRDPRFAKADADAIRIKALADADVVDQFAREMEMRRIDVQRVAAYGDRTVFVPTGNGAGADVSGSIAGNVLGAASAAVGIASMK